MKIIPGVLNWSYHRQFWNHWNESLYTYIDKVTDLKKRYQFDEMGFDVGMAEGQDAFKSHDKNYILEVGKKLADAGLKPIPVIGTVAVHADLDMVNASIESIKHMMGEASLLGAKTVQFHSDMHGRLSKEKAVRVYHNALAEIDRTAGDLGLVCCSEEYCSFTGDELYLAMKGFKNVGLLNDVGNWLILGEDPVAVSKKFIDQTVHLHLKDYIFEDGIWQSVPFGRGIVDLNRVLDMLYHHDSDRVIYAAFETDLDQGDEDEAIEECFKYYKKWNDGKNIK
jgi:sugar phosphate isomerase/epimerase